MTINYPLTEDHFEAFQKAVNRWLERFGLHLAWRAYFFFEEPVGGGKASCAANLDGRIASFRLNPVWEKVFPSDEEIESTAKHEALELLMAPMDVLASSRFATPAEIDAERHAVIRTLEKLLV